MHRATTGWNDPGIALEPEEVGAIRDDIERRVEQLLDALAPDPEPRR
jgi:hypothetical protein